MSDIISFSETRAQSQTIDLEGGHRLYLPLEENVATGVGILVHRHRVRYIRKVHFISDRVLRLDIIFGCRKLAWFALYIPHSGYSLELLDQVYNQLLQSISLAISHGFGIILRGDFNMQLDVGNRG